MRWDSLFDDLESQLERELTAEEHDVEAEEERLRLARLGLRDRLVALTGQPVGVVLEDGTRLVLRPQTVGRDWIAADTVGEPAGSCILPLAAIDGLVLERGQVGASVRVMRAAEHPPLAERLGLPFVLRDLCRRRRFVRLESRAATVAGTIDRVGRDHLDLAIHEAGTPRRESLVREVRVVRLDSVRLVRLG